MVLSDRDIIKMRQTGGVEFYPRPGEHDLQPASVDMHLGGEFAVYAGEGGVIDLRHPGKPKMVKTHASELVLRSGQFALATTREVIALGDSIAAHIEGRSSIARLGLMVHAAGFVDPGFRGTITLELSNMSPHAIVVREGDSVCQVVFHRLASSSERPYGDERGSRYQGQSGVQVARASRGGEA